MGLSKVWFCLLCATFKEPTAHLWAEICSLCMVEATLRPSAGRAPLGQKLGPQEAPGASSE